MAIGPFMRIISENSEEDLARQQAEEAARRAEGNLDYALRNLTANLIRVVRGAGRPHEIASQAQSFIDALKQYHAAAEHLSMPCDLAAFLRINRQENTVKHMSDDEIERHYSEDSIIRGALQIAASRLLDQRTHEHVGENQMRDGMREVERLRSELRRRRSTHDVAKQPRSKRRRRKPSKA